MLAGWVVSGNGTGGTIGGFGGFLTGFGGGLTFSLKRSGVASLSLRLPYDTYVLQTSTDNIETLRKLWLECNGINTGKIQSKL